MRCLPRRTTIGAVLLGLLTLAGCSQRRDHPTGAVQSPPDDILRPRLVVQTGHTDAVRSVAFSPDGRLLASGSKDKTVKLWDTRRGVEVRTLAGYTSSVISVAFSPDGGLLASGSRDDTVRLWDVAAGRESYVLAGHAECSGSVAFSPDSHLLVSRDSTARLWDVATGRQLRTFAGHLFVGRPVSFSADARTLATGGWDGAVRLWDADTGRLLATRVGLGESDWVMVTPDGRFDGTPEGLKALHWAVGNTPIALEQFFETFYTPNLLARVMGGEALPPVEGPDFAQAVALPPEVRITSPREGEQFQTGNIQITVEATNQGGGIDEIRLYQNGKCVSEAERDVLVTGAPGQAATRTFTVTLVPGRNYFRATAFNRDRTESRGYELAIELSAATPTCDLYVVAVGIGDYRNDRYDLQYPRADAEAFVEAVKKRGAGIFRQIVVEEVLDQDAVKGNVEAAFGRIAAKCRPEDAFILYYSGHDAMSEPAEGAPADYYLVMSDVMQIYGGQGLSENGLSARRLTEECRQVKAQKMMVLLDSCASSAALQEFATGGMAMAMTKGPEEEKAIAQLARSAGIMVLAACLTAETAKETPKLGHGLFTYALLEALEGKAGGQDGRITVSQLKAYVEERVYELTGQYARSPQRPAGWFAGQDFPLGVT